jgi:hypothetical protein
MGTQEFNTKGLQLLAEVNIIRAILGRDPIGKIPIIGAARAGGACAIAHSAGCGATNGMTTDWRRALTLKFGDENTTEAAARSLGQPFNADYCEVLAPEPMKSFDLASHFGLIFVRENTLQGWIDPRDADPTTWDLHLMPGVLYPPGHEPN